MTLTKHGNTATGTAIGGRRQRFFERVVTAGVDYITVTCREKRGYDFLTDFVSGLMRRELDKGHTMSSWYLRGFDGRTAGSVQLASDGPTLMVRLSGEVAWSNWRTVLPHATNVSRLDLQSTIFLKPCPAKFAEMCESQALKFESEHHHGRQIELRRNSVTGKTVYIGTPRSDRLIRIYDKGRESKLDHYTDCWRAEVQFGRKIAPSIAAQLVEWVSGEHFAVKTVFESLKRAGVPWYHVMAKEVLIASPGRPRSPLETKMLWLESQVRPTVRKLLAHMPRADVEKALGLNVSEDKED